MLTEPALRRLFRPRAAADAEVGRGGGPTNLFTRLLIVVAVATLPAVGVLAYLEHNLRTDSRARMADEALRQAELLNADMSNVVEGARQLSLAITHFAAVQTANPACRSNLLELLADLPSYNLLSVIGGDGEVICSTDPGLPAWATAATAAHIREVIARGKFDVGTYLAPTPTRGASLPLRMPFTTDTGRQAVVVAGLSLRWLGAHISELKRPPESTIAIADRNGVIVARFPERDTAGSDMSRLDMNVGGLLALPLRPYINAAHRGNTILRGPDGQDRLIGFVPASEKPVGLFVSIGLYLPDMLASLDQATLHGIVLIVIGALVSLWLALWAGHRFVRRPTVALLAAARRWTAGDLSARAVLGESPRSEFGSLASAFNDMAAALDRQHRELRELNATLEARVERRTSDLMQSRNRLQVEIAEREKTATTLRQAQKLQAVGQLAGGIAHDFNNLLTAVVGSLDLLRGRLAPGQEGLARLVDSALRAAERGSRLTSQLLTFSRRQRLLAVPTDLNTIVMELSTLLGSTLGRSIRIQTDLVADLWPAMVDPSQIEAAIINLAINARDAMPDGGVLTLATRNLTLGGGGGIAPGDYVAVRVIDTGTGMAPDVSARVFEPFFTTKEPGRGSGLGLSQVHGLAAQSGGDVRIETRLGEGTAVTLLLPRAAAQLVARPDRPAGWASPRRRARVLVVDDDRDVRETVGEMLRECGYAVEPAAGPDEALAILQGDAAIDAMLVDYVMPGMNGAALIAEAQKIRPPLRCLLMTGHADPRDGESLDAENIMRKPFNVATLQERLERLLARPQLRVIQDVAEDGGSSMYQGR
jgi:signal transduction histidine kinase/CheY-like chemotaxis protein